MIAEAAPAVTSPGKELQEKNTESDDDEDSFDFGKEPYQIFVNRLSEQQTQDSQRCLK